MSSNFSKSETAANPLQTVSARGSSAVLQFYHPHLYPAQLYPTHFYPPSAAPAAGIYLMEHVAPPSLLPYPPPPTTLPVSPTKTWGGGGVSRQSAPGFVGNYIHEPSMVGLCHYRKQRPSKWARQRIRQKIEAKSGGGGSCGSVSDGGSGGIGEKQMATSESGYETTGDQQPSGNGEKTGSEKIEKKEEDDSNGSGSTSSVFKRSLKDLHRCDVAITRYQESLQQHCSEGEKELERVFTILYQRLKARQNDLVQDLRSVRKTASSILERRKATLSYLKQVAAKNNELEETQVSELIQQMKQFVTDRKVDEEIGTIVRFQSDIDDILPHIMGFGRVSNVRHLYAEWEENPTELILRSKSGVTFLPAVVSGPSGQQSSIDEQTEEQRDPQTALLANTDEPSSDKERVQITYEDSGFLSVPDGSLSSGGSSLDEDTAALSDSMHKPAPSAPPASVSGAPHSKTQQRSAGKGNKSHAEVEKENRARAKYSPEQLKAIQARVKDSLKNQGVYLYDPFTGAGPPKEAQEGRKTEGEDKEREHEDRVEVVRKKKTPTQLRRERKKRQKERERRQRELEKAASEESDAQATTPLSLPSQVHPFPSSSSSSSVPAHGEEQTNSNLTPPTPQEQTTFHLFPPLPDAERLELTSLSSPTKSLAEKQKMAASHPLPPPSPAEEEELDALPSFPHSPTQLEYYLTNEACISTPSRTTKSLEQATSSQISLANPCPSETSSSSANHPEQVPPPCLSTIAQCDNVAGKGEDMGAKAGNTLASRIQNSVQSTEQLN